MPTILQVQNLTVNFRVPQGTLQAVSGVSFSLDRGETLAIVGESGCGKSVTAYSIMGLVASPGSIAAGEIVFAGRDLLRLDEQEMRKIRGNRIAMIFQEPMTSLNPVLSIGAQIIEGLRLHRGLSRREAREAGIGLLEQVGIASSAVRFDEYPHQMSGGMRQRVMIAMSIACNPELLIADEPTTALDVTIQAQILELMDRLKRENRMGMILITHDLGIVAERSHRTAVMYAGKIVEYGPTGDILRKPGHPYTEGLLKSLPQDTKPGQPLQTIPGSVPDLLVRQPGCGFCNRCPGKDWHCETAEPEMKEIADGHFVRCWKVQ
ncbi:ABC transporter ATP-binding protein [Geotalea toluenoxydans]|uniref:ABC transporter ATP-binding protein n=1 Tax=Geotalea toluenoxydans TaxID=421624 RepID=UPI0006CFC980|nr:ABC transporter ATP-binding protein [Geotalea toluenoxydans]